ncbi:DUF935 domain-containing protein [bacterium]|nr:DUF935 domain-containing protein [bacterium]
MSRVKKLKQEGASIPALKDSDKDALVQEIASGIAYDMRWYSNWMESYWNPNPVMRSSKFTGYHLIEEMDADGHIYNVMSSRKDALLSKPYYVYSAKPDDPFEDFKAAFVAWNKDHIKELVKKKREMQSALNYGFSFNEMIFGYSDVEIPDRTVKKNGIIRQIKGGRISNALIIKDIKTRVPSAFGFDGKGNPSMVPADPKGITRASAGARLLTEEEIQHFIILTHDPRFGSRYGWPLPISFFWDYLMKKAGKIWRMIYIEKYGMPYLKGTYPAQTNKEGAGGTDQFEARLKGLQKNSWIMTPEGFAIEFVDAMNKSGTIDVYGNLMEFVDGNISEVVLGHRQAVTKNAESPFSTDTQPTLLRQDKLEMDATEHDAAWNDQVIPLLIDFNFQYNSFYPYIVTDVQPQSDKNKRAFQFAAASNLGLDLSRSQVREELALREPEDEADTLRAVGVDMSPLDTGEAGQGGDNMKNQEKDANSGKQTARKKSSINISMSL